MPGDFDILLELRDVADGAETSTVNETAVKVDPAYAGPLEAVVYITAISADSGNESYTFTIAADTVLAMSSPVTVGSRALTAAGSTAAVGEYVIALGTGAAIHELEGDALYLRVGCTMSGTGTSVTYGCYVRQALAKQAGIGNRA